MLRGGISIDTSTKGPNLPNLSATFTSVAKKLKFRTIKRHFRFRKDRSVMSQTLRSMSFSFPLQASSSVVRARLRTEAPEME